MVECASLNPKVFACIKALQQRLQRRGVEVLPGETVSQFCQRAAKVLPEKRLQINALEKNLQSAVLPR